MATSDPPEPTLLRFDRLCSAAEPVHAMRYHWLPARSVGWCRRDHWCCALVESGGVEVASGQRQPRRCDPGCLRIVPPDTPHRVTACDPAGAVESFLLCQADLVADLAATLGPDRPRRFPWQPGRPLRFWELADHLAAEFIDLVNELSMRAPDRLDAIAALTRILQMPRRQGHRSPYSDLPPWLRRGMIELRSPAHLADGVRALARICDRSIDHINRVVRHHRGCTATDLVNELRIELACSLLRLTAEPIAAIADLVGIRDLSHFYQVFKNLRGCTPKAYRQGASSATTDAAVDR